MASGPTSQIGDWQTVEHPAVNDWQPVEAQQPSRTGQVLQGAEDVISGLWKTVTRSEQQKEAEDAIKGGNYGHAALAILKASLPGYDTIVKPAIDQATKAFQYAKAGRYAEAGSSALAAALPGVGPTVAGIAKTAAGEAEEPPAAQVNPVAEPAPYRAAGQAGMSAALAAVPAVAGMAGRTAARVVSPELPQSIMQSALKPGVSDAATMGNVRAVVNTALENEIPANEAGVTKLQGLISDWGKRTQDLVDAKSAAGLKVDPNAVAARLNQVNTSQVLPEKDIATIAKAREAFLTRQGAQPAQAPIPSGLLDANGQPIMRAGVPAQPAKPVPFAQAQAEKQGTYQQNAAKYGEMSQAQIQAEKALARGYKEEMEAQAPELKTLNAKEAELIGLQPVLERAVRRAGNREFVGLSGAAEVGMGAAVGGPVGASAGMVARILEAPEIKSKLAIAINKASQKTATPLGMAASATKATAVLAAISSANQPTQ